MSILTKKAKGQECLVRVPGICCWNPETTVAAHLNGAGVGIKHHDMFAAWACADCHVWLDGGYTRDYDRDYRDLLHLKGMFRTQQKLLDAGLILIKGEK